MSNEINIDMGDRAEALYFARIENKQKEALSLIDDTIIKYPNSYYSLLTKFDIAFKFKNIKECLKKYVSTYKEADYS